MMTNISILTSIKGCCCVALLLASTGCHTTPSVGAFPPLREAITTQDSLTAADSCAAAYRWYKKIISYYKATEPATINTTGFPWQRIAASSKPVVVQLLESFAASLRQVPADLPDKSALQFAAQYPANLQPQALALDIRLTHSHLLNEKNQQVDADTSSVQLSQGNSNGSATTQYVHLSIGTNYQRLKGTVHFQLQMPLGYQYKKLTRADIGRPFDLAGKKMELLEMQDATIHIREYDSNKELDYQLLYTDARGRLVLASYTANRLPESEYTWYRQHPGMTPAQVCEYQQQHPAAKEANKINVITISNANVQELYLYAAGPFATKELNVPVK